jgi:hypothetical protein
MGAAFLGVATPFPPVTGATRGDFSFETPTSALEPGVLPTEPGVFPPGPGVPPLDPGLLPADPGGLGVPGRLLLGPVEPGTTTDFL